MDISTVLEGAEKLPIYTGEQEDLHEGTFEMEEALLSCFTKSTRCPSMATSFMGTMEKGTNHQDSMEISEY